MKDLTIEQRQEIEKAWNGKNGLKSNIECKRICWQFGSLANNWVICDPSFQWSGFNYRVKKEKRNFWTPWFDNKNPNPGKKRTFWSTWW